MKPTAFKLILKTPNLSLLRVHPTKPSFNKPQTRSEPSEIRNAITFLNALEQEKPDLAKIEQLGQEAKAEAFVQIIFIELD